METFRIEDLDIDYPVYLLTSTRRKNKRSRTPFIINFKDSMLDESSTYSRANYLKYRGSEQERSFQGHNEVGTFGVKFYREIPFIVDKRSHPEIDQVYYRVDFYCPEVNLIIELNDDNTHTPEGDQQRYDYFRDKGYTVIPIYRFHDELVKNVELIRNTIDKLKSSGIKRIREDYSYLEDPLVKVLDSKKPYLLEGCDELVHLSELDKEGIQDICRLFPTFIDDLVTNTYRNFLITESDLMKLSRNLRVKVKDSGSYIPSNLLLSIMNIAKSRRVHLRFKSATPENLVEPQIGLSELLEKSITYSKFKSYCKDIYQVSKSHPKFLDDIMTGSGATYEISLQYLSSLLNKKPEISRVDYMEVIMKSLGINFIIKKRVADDLKLEVTRKPPGYYITPSTNDSMGIRSYVALLAYEEDGITRYMNMMHPRSIEYEWVRPNISRDVSTPKKIRLSRSESESTKMYYEILLTKIELFKWCVDRGLRFSLAIKLEYLVEVLGIDEKELECIQPLLVHLHSKLILPLDEYGIHIVLAPDEYGGDVLQYYYDNRPSPIRQINEWIRPDLHDHEWKVGQKYYIKVLDSWYKGDFEVLSIISSAMNAHRSYWCKYNVMEICEQDLDEYFYYGRRSKVLAEGYTPSEEDYDYVDSIP